MKFNLLFKPYQKLFCPHEQSEVISGFYLSLKDCFGRSSLAMTTRGKQ